VGDQQNRLFRVADLIGGEQRLIVLDQRDKIAPRDVAVIHDHDAVPVERRVLLDAHDAPARDRRTHRAPVQQPRHDEIVHVQRAAGDLVVALELGRTCADAARVAGGTGSCGGRTGQVLSPLKVEPGRLAGGRVPWPAVRRQRVASTRPAHEPPHTQTAVTRR
jgi:hypothetical protein